MRSVITLLLLYFILGSSLPTVAQTKREEELAENAEELFEDKEYTQALKIYAQLVSANAENKVFNYRYGACLLLTSDKKTDALRFLEFAVKGSSDVTEAHYYLARAYHISYRFDEAIALYEKFNASLDEKAKKKYDIDQLIKECNSGKKLIRDFKQIKVIKGKKIADAQFYRGYKLGRMDRKILVKPGDFMSKEDAQGMKPNEPILMVHGPNEEIAFFSAYKYGKDFGKVDQDIYYVEKLEDGTWSDWKDVGPFINTDFDESYPYLHPNGVELFFASKGHDGLGGYDLYKSILDTVTGLWGKPENLGFALNSPFDDILYIVDEDENAAYFASDRQNKEGETTVYKIIPPKRSDNFILVKGQLMVEGGSSNAGKIRVKQESTGEFIAQYETNKKTGAFVFPLAELESYKVEFVYADSIVQSVQMIMPARAKKEMVYQEVKMVIKGAEAEIAMSEQSDYVPNESDRLAAIDALSELEENQIEDVKFSPRSSKTRRPSKPKPNSSASTATAVAEAAPQEQKTPAELLANSEVELAEIAEAKKELSLQVNAAYVIAEQKNQEAIAIQKELEQLIREEQVGKASSAIVAAKERQYEKTLKEAEAALKYAKNQEQNFQIKAKEETLTKSYLEALKIATSGKTSDRAIEQLEGYQKKMEQMEKELKAAEENEITAELGKNIEETKTDRSKIEEKVKQLNSTVALIEDEQKLLQDQLDKTRKKSLKEEFSLQIAELEEEKKNQVAELTSAEKQLAGINKELEDLAQQFATYSEIEGAAKSASTAVKNQSERTAVLAQTQAIKARKKELDAVQAGKATLDQSLAGGEATGENAVGGASSTSSNVGGSGMAPNSKYSEEQFLPQDEDETYLTEVEKISAVRVKKTDSYALTASNVGDNTAQQNDELAEKIFGIEVDSESDETNAVVEAEKKKATESFKQALAIQQLAEKKKVEFQNEKDPSRKEELKAQVARWEQQSVDLKDEGIEHLIKAEQEQARIHEQRVKAAVNESPEIRTQEVQELEADIIFLEELIEKMGAKKSIATDVREKSELGNAMLQAQAELVRKQKERDRLVATNQSKLAAGQSLASNSSVEDRNSNVDVQSGSSASSGGSIEGEKDVLAVGGSAEPSSTNEENGASSDSESISTGDSKVGGVSATVTSSNVGEQGAEQTGANGVTQGNTASTDGSPKGQEGNETYVESDEAGGDEVFAEGNATSTGEAGSDGSSGSIVKSDGAPEESKQSNGINQQSGLEANQPADLAEGNSAMSSGNSVAGQSEGSSVSSTQVDMEDGGSVSKGTSNAIAVGNETSTESGISSGGATSTEAEAASEGEGRDQVDEGAATENVAAGETQSTGDFASSQGEKNQDDRTASSSSNSGDGTVKSSNGTGEVLTDESGVKPQGSSATSAENQYAAKAQQLRVEAEKALDPYEKQRLVQEAEIYEIAARPESLEAEKSEVIAASAKVEEYTTFTAEARGRINKNKTAAEGHRLEEKSMELYLKASDKMKEAEAESDPVEQLKLMSEAKEIYAYSSLKQKEALQKYNESRQQPNDPAFDDYNFAVSIEQLQGEEQSTAGANQTFVPVVEGETDRATNEQASAGKVEGTNSAEGQQANNASVNETNYTDAEAPVSSVGSDEKEGVFAQEVVEVQVNSGQSGGGKSDYLLAYERLIKEAQEIEKEEKERESKIQELLFLAKSNREKSEQTLANVQSLSDAGEIQKQLDLANNYREQAEQREVEAKNEEYYRQNNLTEAKAKRKEAALIMDALSDLEKEQATALAQSDLTAGGAQSNVGTNPYQVAANTTVRVKEGLQITNSNKYDRNTKIPVDVELPSGLVYKVQVGAFRNKIDPAIFNGISPLTGERTSSGIIRYTAGLFKSFKAADMAKGRIRNLGYRDAFVVAFYNGKRIPIEEASKMVQQAEGQQAAQFKRYEEIEVAALKKAGIREEEASSTGAGVASPVDQYAQNSAQVNSNSAEVPVQPSGRNSLNDLTGIYYTVQIGVYSTPRTSRQLNGISPLQTYQTSNGYIRYSTGVYRSQAEAEQRKQEVRAAGISDAYVVAYQDGKRIDVASAGQVQTNNNAAANAGATPSNTVSGIVFKVQIGAYRTEVDLSSNSALSQLSGDGVEYTRNGTGLLIYTAGSFTDKAAADALKEKAVRGGVPDAFVVAYNNGVKISVRQALELLGN